MQDLKRQELEQQHVYHVRKYPQCACYMYSAYSWMVLKFNGNDPPCSKEWKTEAQVVVGSNL